MLAMYVQLLSDRLHFQQMWIQRLLISKITLNCPVNEHQTCFSHVQCKES
jgi:hypothetical protein